MKKENALEYVTAVTKAVKFDVYKQVYEPFLSRLKPFAELANVTEEEMKDKEATFRYKVTCLRIPSPKIMASAIVDICRKEKINIHLSEVDFRKLLADRVTKKVYTPQEAGRVLAHVEIMTPLKGIRDVRDLSRAYIVMDEQLGITRTPEH